MQSLSEISIPIMLDIDGKEKYQCPDLHCDKKVTVPHFDRLRKHCMDSHLIILTKLKVKKESTIREENRIAARKLKRQKVIEELDANLSLEKWQQAIMQNYKEKDGNHKLILDKYGVIVLRKFIDSKEVDIMNGCVRIAQLLAEGKNHILEEKTISGGTKMIDINIKQFSQSNVNFSSGAKVMKSITSQLQKIIGEEYSIVGDVSILTTPNGSQKQYIHSDNILKNRYNGLIVLSEFAVPTEFLPKQCPDIAITESPQLNSEDKIVDDSIRAYLREKFGYMWGPIDELEVKMRPLSSEPLKSGDLVLFEADMVHRGDACLDNKTLLFFHARPNNLEAVEDDVQFHAGRIGHYIFGRVPKNQEDRQIYYAMIRMHDESIKDATVRLTDLLGEKTRKSYEKWLDKQRYTPGL